MYIHKTASLKRIVVQPDEKVNSCHVILIIGNVVFCIYIMMYIYMTGLMCVSVFLSHFLSPVCLKPVIVWESSELCWRCVTFSTQGSRPDFILPGNKQVLIGSN